MRATIADLSGKYYGTDIEIDFNDGYDPVVIKLWDTADLTPSVRELATWGYTEKQWDNNDYVDSEDRLVKVRDMDMICDSHFESKMTYERAMKLVNLINSTNTEKKCLNCGCPEHLIEIGEPRP